MKTNLLLHSAIGLLLSVFCFSCSEKEGDTEKPTIVLESPAENDSIRPGAEVHLDMELTDNQELASYKIDIHAAGGHTHTYAEASGSVFMNSWSVAGQKNSHVHHHEIVLPAEAPEGAYHFIVYCLDAAGNESYMVRNVTLSLDAVPEED